MTHVPGSIVETPHGCGEVMSHDSDGVLVLVDRKRLAPGYIGTIYRASEVRTLGNAFAQTVTRWALS